MQIRQLFKAKFLVYLTSFALLNQGCAVFHPEKIKTENGYYKRHCGPVAIQEALAELEGHVSRKEISKEIQDNGNGRRLALTLIHYNALWITWPAELKKYFTKRGYEITETNLESLGPEDVAIVLINGSSIKQEWHWITYPTHSINKIKNYYKKNDRKTKIIKVYKINK